MNYLRVQRFGEFRLRPAQYLDLNRTSNNWSGRENPVERAAEGNGLTGQLTREIRGIVDTAAAVITSGPRVGAKRAGAIDLACRGMRSNDLIRCFPLFDPLFDEADFVEGVGAFSAGAVSHPGDHEEANPVGG